MSREEKKKDRIKALRLVPVGEEGVMAKLENVMSWIVALSGTNITEIEFKDWVQFMEFVSGSDKYKLTLTLDTS